MSGESSKRSNLVDVTYSQLHSILCGQQEGFTTEQISDIIEPRSERLRSISEPFGKPSDASRKAIETGSVTLKDGVVLRVDDVGKEFVIAISTRFEIDEVQAFILLRSFLYNEGLPPGAGSSSDKSVVDELVEAITPFYFSERLFILRVLIPLFRATENTLDPMHDVAVESLSKIVPDGPVFAEALLSEYRRKIKEKAPAALTKEPRKASRWAKQNNKEQLVILEVLFWTMWGFVPCSGQLVVRVLETAYDTNLGSTQQNSTLLLDDEGFQLQQDSAALWVLIGIEVLELERIAESDGVEISSTPKDTTTYTSSPESLRRIHELVISHGESQYVCLYLAWAFVLSRLTAAVEKSKEVPSSYQSFFGSILPHLNRSKDREPFHATMARSCLVPEARLFELIMTFLTSSPLFVTAAAWKSGSTITDPNAIAFRSVLKGLVIALVELIPVELVPDFDGLLDVWIALFGRSESQSVAGICQQYWQQDWKQGFARRAVFDVARSRFPIQFKPLIRLLRSVTAFGFLDTDPLSIADHVQETEGVDEERDICNRHVFYYLDKLPTYSQVIPSYLCTGGFAIYEKAQERNGPSMSLGTPVYVNLYENVLPGGSVLPARSTGRLLSGDGGELIPICWQHEHCGWHLILQLLRDYVKARRLYTDVTSFDLFSRVVQSMTLRDIGMESNGDDEEDVTDALDLIRSIIQDDVALAQQLLDRLEPPDSHSSTHGRAPDLVQLVTMILEDALSRPTVQATSPSRPQLITTAISVLSALLPIPKYSLRVWLYIRSTSALFNSNRLAGFSSAALATERVTGHYTMTLALLKFVHQLFLEASASLLTVLPGNRRLQQVKEEVLLRAFNFIHGEIWVEHLNWKYAQLGDRFEIGRRVCLLYADILTHAPPGQEDRPFTPLSRAIADALLDKATTSSIHPIVSSISAGPSALQALYQSRRFADARRLIYVLESLLRLVRLILNYKLRTASAKSCLLEQALCARVAGNASIINSTRSRIDLIDILALYVTGRDVGSVVPIEAIRVLCSLCTSLAASQSSPPTVIGHLTNPEATVNSFIRLVQHPYDDLSLRITTWRFISLAIDKEPALASLFVTGSFQLPSGPKDKRKPEDSLALTMHKDRAGRKPSSAVDVAMTTLVNWRDLWEHNPELLASVLCFLDIVWQHILEHKELLDATRDDSELWGNLAGIVQEELGPSPDYTTDSFVIVDGIQRSNLHDAVSAHAYRTILKSYALHIIGLDIGVRQASGKPSDPPVKTVSYSKIESVFKTDEQLAELVLEASASSYDPTLYDDLMQLVNSQFPALSLEQLESQEVASDRVFGDDFAFSMTLLRSRLHHRSADEAKASSCDEAETKVSSINLNLSLTHAQTALVESWQFLLRQVTPFVRSQADVRPNLLSLASSISADLASERRSGDLMARIHGNRLSLLLSLLEAAWFSTNDKGEEVEFFISLVQDVHGILRNESQSPSNSLLGQVSVPFHSTLLQIVYFCVRHSRNLAKRPKLLNAEQRLTISNMIEAALTFVIDALRFVFDSARSRQDIGLDRDMEFLVAVFEQCTRPDINHASPHWLTRCQETDIFKASLELFVRVDLVGLSDLSLLRTRKQTLYAPHLLQFFMALASISSSAERLAGEGIISAFCNNILSPAISAGRIDVILTELPGERSPAHRAYCSMLAILASVVTALGRHNHFFDSNVCGFVQLYGDQIARALGWTVADSLTFPLLEEMEQVLYLFHAIAESRPSAANANPAVAKIFRVFSTRSLVLLQQINYAVTHPNQLASLLEPVTVEERAQIEKESKDSMPLSSSTGMLNPNRHPIVVRLVHRLFRLSSLVMSTLISTSRAYDVMLTEREEWPIHEALIVPHSKVVVGEPTSLGTLLELGNCTLDVLKELVNRPAGQAILGASTSTEALDVHEAVLTARAHLEASLVYAVTQLAMWLSKPDFDVSASGEVDMEEAHPTAQQQQQPIPLAGGQRNESAKERKARRASLTLAERLRRGMTGEMAADLQSLIAKTRPVLLKSADVVGAGDVDLTSILSQFVTDHVTSAV